MKNYNGADLGQSFRRLYTADKAVITKQLKALGCTNVQMSRQFYYYYGFFTAASGQAYYFSCSDVRYFDHTHLLVRTAAGYADYTGGVNTYVPITGLYRAVNGGVGQRMFEDG